MTEIKEERLPYVLGEIREIRFPYFIDYAIEAFAKKEGRSFTGMMIWLLALAIHMKLFEFKIEEYLDTSESEKAKTRYEKNSIPLSLRFEVLKRDKFICQYCGKTPPEVKLEIDHRIPESKGGETTTDNLITACFECNRGKFTKEL